MEVNKVKSLRSLYSSLGGEDEKTNVSWGEKKKYDTWWSIDKNKQSKGDRVESALMFYTGWWGQTSHYWVLWESEANRT